MHMLLALGYLIAEKTIGVGFIFHQAFTWTLPSDVTLTFTNGDLYVLITIIFLMVEVIKSVETGWSSIANHIASTLGFIGAFALFITVPEYSTKVWGVLTACSFVDVVAGFTITAAAARRDFGVG